MAIHWFNYFLNKSPLFGDYDFYFNLLLFNNLILTTKNDILNFATFILYIWLYSTVYFSYKYILYL